MRNLSLSVAILTFLALAVSASAFEGVWEETEKVEAKSPDLMPGEFPKVSHTTVYFKNGMVKTIDKGTGYTFIFRPDRELMWIIDTMKGAYREITFQDMGRMIERSKQMVEKMRKELDSLPPEQRKAMEKMMDEVYPKESHREALSYRSTGKKSKILGYSCENYVIERRGSKVAEMWVSDEIDLGKEFYEGFNKMFEVLSGAQSPPGKELYDIAKKIEGFPLKSTYIFGNLVTTSEVTRFEEKKLDDGEFELPKGLRKIEAMGRGR